MVSTSQQMHYGQVAEARRREAREHDAQLAEARGGQARAGPYSQAGPYSSAFDYSNNETSFIQGTTQHPVEEEDDKLLQRAIENSLKDTAPATINTSASSSKVPTLRQNASQPLVAPIGSHAEFESDGWAAPTDVPTGTAPIKAKYASKTDIWLQPSPHSPKQLSTEMRNAMKLDTRTVTNFEKVSLADPGLMLSIPNSDQVSATSINASTPVSQSATVTNLPEGITGSATMAQSSAAIDTADGATSTNNTGAPVATIRLPPHQLHRL